MIRSIYNLQSPRTGHLAVALAVLVVTSAACGGTRIGASTAVTGSRFTATELIARIKTALLNDREIGARRIDVHAIEGDITLSGRVASAAERDRAVAITRAVEGVSSVASRLEIQRWFPR